MKRWLVPRNVLLVGLMAFFGDFGHAYSPDMDFLEGASELFERYQKEHDGELPQSWNDLVTDSRDSLQHYQDNFEAFDRYAILRDPLPLNSPEGTELIVVSRRPFRDFGRRVDETGQRKIQSPLYYGLIRFDNFRVSRFRFRPDELTNLFVSSGRNLPQPDSLAERPHIVQMKEERLLLELSRLAIPLFILLAGSGAWIWWLRRRRKNGAPDRGDPENVGRRG